MIKKGIAVWFFSILTFIAFIHVFEAASALFYNGQIVLLKYYPFINELNVTPIAYFFGSFTAAIIFWGIACVVALRNPMEDFMERILSDIEVEGRTDDQILEEKRNILSLIYETLEMNRTNISQVKDLLLNVRAGVIDFSRVRDDISGLEVKIRDLAKLLKKIEGKIDKPLRCPVCGRPIQADFKVCPYCGENLTFIPANAVALEKYK